MELKVLKTLNDSVPLRNIGSTKALDFDCHYLCFQFWDYRRPDKVEKQFTAHGGPVFSIDWHPEERNWFATAGRDKMIKVFDLFYTKLFTKHYYTPASKKMSVYWLISVHLSVLLFVCNQHFSSHFFSDHSSHPLES